MRNKIKSIGWVLIFLCVAAIASAQNPFENCVQVDQSSGSLNLICRAQETDWNGSLVIWAHGFQDYEPGPPEIPLNQLSFGDNVNIIALLNELGFDFATSSYSKKGLAIVEGSEDILDLVGVYSDLFGPPEHVYLVGASEGGIITALMIEQNPDVFRAGLALCGPVGDFPYQINYLGDARVTFQYFFPGVLPKFSCSGDQVSIEDWCKDWFDPAKDPSNNWDICFEKMISPVLFDPANRARLNQWLQVANIAYDPADYIDSVKKSASDVLRYSMLNLEDAVETLGGFPFDNKRKWYRGSDRDLRLNLLVKRCRADAGAVLEMKTHYNTSGSLQHPLITMHTRLDQQVPYIHELFYNWKTFFQGSFLTKHINLPVDRYGHCNFTLEEALFSFSLMLLYAGDLDLLSGVETILQGSGLEDFKQMAEEYGLPYTTAGSRLRALLK